MSFPIFTAWEYPYAFSTSGRSKKYSAVSVLAPATSLSAVAFEVSALLQLLRSDKPIKRHEVNKEIFVISRPILPLASADRHGMVVYVGSLTKSVAPAFRVGYVVAPATLIDELARLRRIIDWQGDAMLEFAVGQLIKTGDLQRHFRKALRTYHARRDHFCHLLTTELPDAIEFTKPDGGMAVWARFNPSIDMAKLAKRAEKDGLFLSSGASHNPPGQQLNGTRLGFASSTESELDQAVAILKKIATV